MNKLFIASIILSLSACTTTHDIATCSANHYSTLQEDAQAMQNDAVSLQNHATDGLHSNAELISEAQCLRPRVDEVKARTHAERPDLDSQVDPMFDQVNSLLDSISQ